MEINTPAVIGPGEFFPVVGVGPHEKPWPTGPQYDPELLENGDRRNVLDHYRYWTVEAIVADLNTKRHNCLLYTSPSPRDTERSRMPSSA